MSQIDDGKGSGNRAEVNEFNQLVTKAVTNCDCKVNSEDQKQSYEFATGEFISVTTTAEHALLYIKNTSSVKHMHIHEIRTCGTATQKWLLYKNDTAGTIVTDATAAVEVNHNFSSSNVADADVYKGADGKTRSGGAIMSQHINEEGHSEVSYEGALILGQNDSITLTVQNVDSATKEACIRVHAYFENI